MERTETAFIGFGYRGKQLFRLMRHIPFFNVVAIADPCACPEDIPGVACYNQGENDYLRMLEERHPALVIVSSPWMCHVVHAMESVRRGCHVALEIKGGLAENEYWPLADCIKGKDCRVFPLENTLFLREIQSVNRMVHEGALGEIVYMRGGYRHDLRSILLDDAGNIGSRKHTESIWRSKFYQTENGDLYPTHGLAPLCMMAGIGREDRLERLTSFATKAAGLRQKIADLRGDISQPVSTGDVVSTQIETAGGVLISLTHDTTLPRPRSLDFEVQGTRGIWRGDERKIYIEGQSPRETWEDDESYISRYESDYWKRWGADALEYDTHHQGMDYIMLKAVEADLTGSISYPVTLTDLALWTSVSPLSKKSILERRTVSF